MNIQNLIEDISVKAYEMPLSLIREIPEWPILSNPLHIAILLIDFDTEVLMQGLLGFLGNQTGAYLDQTIEAFRLVGAEQTAITLDGVRDAMIRHGVSHKYLREPFGSAKEYQITSFAELHGPELNGFAAEIEQLSEALYMHTPSAESPWPLIESYLESRIPIIQSELRRRGAGA